MVENIILWVTIFQEPKKVDNKVKKEYGDVLHNKESVFKKIKGLTYSGWGRLSKEFLVDLMSAPNQYGECKSIIQVMRETNENLNEVLFNPCYKFNKELENANAKNISGDITYKNVEDLYCSP